MIGSLRDLGFRCGCADRPSISFQSCIPRIWTNYRHIVLPLPHLLLISLSSPSGLMLNKLGRAVLQTHWTLSFFPQANVHTPLIFLWYPQGSLHWGRCPVWRSWSLHRCRNCQRVSVAWSGPGKVASRGLWRDRDLPLGNRLCIIIHGFRSFH